MLLANKIFEEFANSEDSNDKCLIKPYEIFTINELYYWWQLTGGDVLLELKKQGLIRSSPPILSIPKYGISK